MHRDGADVPGSLIPYLYRQYLQTGDGREMTRVLYHNEQDILSMVALGVILCRVFEQPAAPFVPIEDRLSLARWYEQRGMLAECEAAYRAAIDDDSDGDVRCDALAGLATLLRRSRRYEEAVSYWEYLADLKLNTVGHEALAKYYEWQAADLSTALHWTEAGLRLADSWGPGLRRAEATRLLEHRRARLIAKINQRTLSR
jgi:tetratricopeptide (TPR) repeat protein